MTDNPSLFKIGVVDIDDLALRLRQVLKTERDEEYAQETVARAIGRILERKIEAVAEELLTVGSERYQELVSMLEEPLYSAARGISPKTVPAALSVEAQSAVEQRDLFPEELNDLNGYRKYSPQRHAAMIEHLAFRCKGLLKTKLYKLLFYADFWSYIQNGQSMSGAVYLKLPHGPVSETARSAVSYLTRRGKLRPYLIKTKKVETEVLRSNKTYTPSKSVLGADELRLLDEVAAKLGHLNSGEISDLSHEELGWKSLRIGEAITYLYSRTLKIRPDAH